jgi:hypothetical protein
VAGYRHNEPDQQTTQNLVVEAIRQARAMSISLVVIDVL